MDKTVEVSQAARDLRSFFTMKAVLTRRGATEHGQSIPVTPGSAKVGSSRSYQLTCKRSFAMWHAAP
jgi:hypothetical protein